MTIKLRVGNNVPTSQVCTARTERTISLTYVGKSAWSDPYLSGSIAGLYAVDALLTEPEIVVVISRMNAGEDTLQAC